MKIKYYNIIIFSVALLIIIIFGCRKENTIIKENAQPNSDCIQYKEGAIVITYDSDGWPHGTTQDSVKNCYEENWRTDGIEWTTYYD